MAVRLFKRPGAMTIIEAQSMDMTAMKAPAGAVPVATEIVTRSTFSGKVTYTGSVAPYTEQTIYPRVEGWLRQITVYNGDRVAAGRLLASIDSPDLQSKVNEAAAGRESASSEVSIARMTTAKMSAERSAAQMEVSAARSELAGAKARLAAARKQVTQAQKELNAANANREYWQAEIYREENLLKAGAVSVQEYQAEKAQAAAAEAEAEGKDAKLAEAKANVDAAEADAAAKTAAIRVAQQRTAAAGAAAAGARKEVEQKSASARQAAATESTAAIIDSYRQVRAPFAGVVTRRYVSPGQLVNPSTGLLNIVQIDRVRLQANVADKDLGKIRLGSPVVARFTKYPGKVYTASVTSISPLADEYSRTAVVEAVTANPGHRLVPGDFLTMEITTSTIPGSISVPTASIVHREGREAVWIVKSAAAGSKKAHLVFVTLGDSSGDRTAVTYGLSEGDEVIYEGHTYLREGDTVFPTKWSSEGPVRLPPAPEMGEMPGMDHGANHPAGHAMPGTPTMGEQHGADRSMAPSHKGMAKPHTMAAKTYVCPMHSDVTSHKAGQECPKCGMALVEKK